MPRAIFIHIPKTAGVSLHRMLAASLGDSAISPPFVASRLTPDDARDLARYDIVFGHISIDDVARFFPGIPMLTVLREPIERCLSWYHYARGVPVTTPEVAAAHDNPVDAFFALPLPVIHRNIYNRQVRQLGGHVLDTEGDDAAMLKRAARTIAACAWVGELGRLRDDVERLAGIIPGVDPGRLAHEHVSDRSRIDAPIGPTLAESIRQLNLLDIALHDSVMGRRRC